MDTFAVWPGPVVVAQLVTPFTPRIVQVPVDNGATAPLGPVTVAVKVTVAPSAAEAVAAVTTTVGVVALTEVEKPEVGDVPK